MTKSDLFRASLGLMLVAVLLLLSLPSWAEAQAREEQVSEFANDPGHDWGERAHELVFHALAFLGVKYRFGGTDPDTGWDCSGYVSHVFNNAVGIVLPRNSVAMSERGEPIERANLQPGDLVFFHTLKHAFSHVGIYLGEQRFIHAPSTGKAVQISDMNANYWARRFNGGRRIVAAR
jgi:cell wall-associated NlpC family hydrolase